MQGPCKRTTGYDYRVTDWRVRMMELENPIIDESTVSFFLLTFFKKM